MRTATIASQVESSFEIYAIQLISDFLGLDLAPSAKSGSAADVYHGNDGYPCKLRIPLVASYSPTDVPVPPACMIVDGAYCNDEPFPFDLFAAIRFWLGDEGNAACADSAFDVHGRLLAENSLQARLKVLELPVVNAYLMVFRQWFTARFKIFCRSRLPFGKKCAVVLTHDVDNPINPGYPFHHLGLAQLALRNKRPRTALRLVGNAILRAAHGIAHPGERRWLFPDIIKAEGQYGFRSTFFFASRSKAEGHELDVSYNVKTSRFCHLLREIALSGSEIGLHASYRSGESATLLAVERQRLERVTQSEIKGARHHYWHLTRRFWDTLDRHAESGIKYDCSVSFNDAPGFRLGIAYPFQPWNPLSERPIKTLQIPTFLMDGALFEYGREKADGALDTVVSLLSCLKRYEGVAALDWHEYTSFPGSREFRDWGQAYLNVLEILNADSEIAVFAGSDVFERWDRAGKLDYRWKEALQ